MRKGGRLGIYLISGLVFLGMAATSCNKEEVISQPQDNPGKTEIIQFGINKYSNWAPDELGGAPDLTKSQGRRYTEPVPMDCVDGEGPATEIHMYMIEEEIPPVVDTIATKADGEENYKYGIYAYQVPQGIIDDNTNSSYEVLSGTTGVGPFAGMTNIGLAEDGSTYGGGPKYWPGAAWWLQFYMYAPYVASGSLAKEGAEYFKITESNNQPVLTYTVPTTITEQIDLLDGASGLMNGNSLTAVPITLTHLLSQIEVKAGTLDEGTIHSVTFTNIYNKGERIMASAEKDNQYGWILLTTDGVVPTTGETASTTTYKQDVEKEISALTNGTSMSTMYLLPQALSDDATIEVVLTITSDDPTQPDAAGAIRSHRYTLRKNLKQFIAEWKPNKKYTYILSTPQEVEIEVNDEVVQGTDGNPVKQNLVIKNNGLSTVYLRASLIGEWVIPNETGDYNDDIIVADWTKVADPDKGKTPDGIFTYNGGRGSGPDLPEKIGNWIKIGSYYYYKKPVESGDVLDQGDEKLFETFTLTANPPMANAVFDLTIIVQAVYYEDVLTAWPEAKITGTDGTLTAAE